MTVPRPARSTTRWHKLGRLFCPDPEGDPARPWLVSHAALPWAHVTSDRVQVYFSPRDRDGRAHIARVDLTGLDGREQTPGDVPRVIDLPRAPVLSPGELGTFDDCGVTMSCLVRDRDRLLLYYSGWTVGQTVPFYFYVGLAASDDGGRTFERVSRAPILERDATDPFLTASPSVLIDGGIWRMWYVSARGWRLRDGRLEPTYHIRYAESRDGVAWKRTGRVCLDFAMPDEYAFGRPVVVRDRDIYRMWYCVRGSTYRIGYAESQDGLSWTRLDDQAGIEPSPTGWDADMLAYPCVFVYGGREYLLYNGNGYGQSGFGAAVRDRLVSDEAT